MSDENKVEPVICLTRQQQSEMWMENKRLKKREHELLNALNAAARALLKIKQWAGAAEHLVMSVEKAHEAASAVLKEEDA